MLAIYLNDHLTAATGARELARRAERSNHGTRYGSFLRRLVREIDEDRSALFEIMRRLGIRIDRLKVIGGWGAEKLGRLKLNGRLIGYSPLSRLVELEALTLGVSGKLGLWRVLLELDLPELDAPRLRRLVRRAESQLKRVEEQRLRAAAEALCRSD